MKHSNTKVLLIIVSVILLGSCLNKNSSSNKESEKKDEFLVTIEELQKDDAFKRFTNGHYFIEWDCVADL